MADEKLQYELNFKTRAETAPVEEVTKKVRDLAFETERLQRLSAPEKVRFTEAAYYDLNSTLTTTTNTSAKLVEKVEAGAKATKGHGLVIQQAGYQVQDFAVQVAAGGNAVNALVQQGSQMAGVFGPGGAVIGALLALGGVAYQVFSATGDNAEGAAKKAEKLRDVAKEVADNVAAASAEDIDFALEAITLAKEEAERLRDVWKETNAARAAAETASLNNAEIIRRAMVQLRELQGQQIDQQKEIQAREEAEAAQRQLKARQETDAANKRLDDAREEVAVAKEVFEKRTELVVKGAEDLQQARQTLEVRRAERDELQKLAKERIALTDATLPDLLTGRKPQSARDAEKKLNTQDFQTELAVLEREIARLEDELRFGGELTQQLAGAARSFDSALRTAEDIAGAVANDLPRIQQTLEAADVSGTVGAAVASAEAVAAEVRAGVEGFEAVTEQQKQAKTDLQRLYSDGKITFDEIDKANAALRELVNTANGEQLKTLLSITAALQTFSNELREVKRQVEGIRGQTR